jgi:hypothetical protein
MFRHRTRLITAAALVLTALVAPSAADTRVDTPSGPLTVKTHDDAVQVTVQQGGRRVLLRDTATKKEVVLDAGAFQLELGDGLKVSADQFTLKRGDKVIAEVRREAPGVTDYARPATAPAPPCPPPPAAPGLPGTPEPPLAQRDAHSEQELYDRAEALSRSGEHEKAVAAWHELLRLDPDSPSSVYAQMRLGLGYWNIARNEDRHSRDEANADERRARRQDMLTRARDAFHAVEHALLSARFNGEELSAADARRLQQASFWGAETCFYLGDYEEAARRYAVLERRYAGRPEELLALSQKWHCQVSLGREDQARAAMSRLRERLTEFKDEVFDGSLETRKREFWVKWLTAAEKAPTGSF